MADDAVVLLVVTECVWVDDQVRSHGQRDIRPAVTFPSELPPPGWHSFPILLRVGG